MWHKTEHNLVQYLTAHELMGIFFTVKLRVYVTKEVGETVKKRRHCTVARCFQYFPSGDSLNIAERVYKSCITVKFVGTCTCKAKNIRETNSALAKYMAPSAYTLPLVTFS
jgi:hypothetical protein